MAPTEFVAFDLETTGLSAAFDRIVEIGAVRFSVTGDELGRFQSLVNPGRPIPRAAHAIHGIDDEDVADAPSVEGVLPRFLEFLGEPTATILLAHNASFDAGFLGGELTRAQLPIPGFGVVDTLALSRSVRPELPTHRLEYLARLYNLNPDAQHRALGDCNRVKELWLRLGGPRHPADRLVTFPIFDPARSRPTPRGWDSLERAIRDGHWIRMEYEGGTRGNAPRTITPRSVEQRGGIVYIVAVCHLANREKSFRLDRIRRYEVITASASSNSV